MFSIVSNCILYVRSRYRISGETNSGLSFFGSRCVLAASCIKFDRASDECGIRFNWR